METLTSSTGGDTNVPTLEYQGPGGTDGQWVTGTFVADATMTETLDLSASNSNASFGDSGSPRSTCFNFVTSRAFPNHRHLPWVSWLASH